MDNLNLEQAFTVLKLTSDSSSSLPLQEQVLGLVPQTRFLILDLENVEFNSMRIGEVVNVYTAFRRHWGDRPHRMALVHLSEFSKQAIHTVRLNEKIPVYDTVDEALAALQGPAAATATA